MQHTAHSAVPSHTLLPVPLSFAPPCSGLRNVRVVWSRAEDGGRDRELRDVSSSHNNGLAGWLAIFELDVRTCTPILLAYRGLSDSLADTVTTCRLAPCVRPSV